jgi:NAD(P)-dependent dehydrogenase (short-subunit alcohol dehydrogenase family)
VTPRNFEGRVVIVTGSGRGLGAAYARELAARGAGVVLNSRVPAAGERSSAEVLAAEIAAAGGRAVAYNGSVADPAVARALVECALDTFGRLDGLVNNAGQTHRAPFGEVDPADLTEQLRTHVVGALLVTQQALPHLRRAGAGRVVMTGSHAAVFGRPHAGGYAPAMYGVVGLANAAAIEAEADGVLVNTVLPVALTPRSRTDAAVQASPEARAMGVLLPRLTPEHVVPLVVHLLSEACTTTKGVYAAVGGHFAQVFTGVAPGWAGPGEAPPTAEDVAAHWSEIVDPAGYRTPSTMREYFEMLNEPGALGPVAGGEPDPS